MCEDPEINKLKDDVKEHTAAVRARHIVAALVAVGFALCGAVETSSSVALLANQVDNHAIIDTSWHCDMLVNLSRRNRTEDAEFGRTELSLEERDESRMREAFLWGQVAGPILGGCLVWGRTGPSMVFSRAVLSACLASLLVPAAWRGPSHVALRLLQGLCTVGKRAIIIIIRCHDACCSHARHDMVQKHAQKLVFQLLRSCKCRLLSYWLARHGGGESLRKRLAVLRSHDTGIVLVLHFRPLRQRQSQILSTRYQFWASAVATMGNQWGDATLALGMTKYLKLIYGFSTANDSVLTTLPHIGHFMAALTCGLLVDHVRESKIVSTTTARKLVVYTAHFIPAALLFVAGYAGCQALGAAWLGIAALLVSGTAPAGALAAIADLAPAESPACAAAACALCSTLGAAGLLAANYFVTQALHASIAGSWRLVFGVASIVLLITAAVFLALGKGVPQPWIPSVARPCSHDVIYEQDGLELDYEDVAVQTEPYDLYGADDDDEDNPKDIEKEQKESNSLQTTVAVIKNETNNYIIKANIEVYV
uniref:Major facilitator superfamily (MFS) profile domain-containing protein n=1 Tax=Trichogramma kaykai TaxID=54128 RepID=A0ABD2VVF3_9HYME